MKLSLKSGICLCIPLIPLYALSPSQKGASVLIRVSESVGGRFLPCRITVLNERAELASVEPVKAPHIAYRTGVIYTGTGIAEFTAPPGHYTVYVTRGLEYALGAREMDLRDRPIQISFKLEREVDTDRYLAADTHIHTLTHSGHGDATMEERMATIAGEGIELAVATDHNHHTDYRPTARQTQTHEHFTPVIGNEVTTSVGHFNIFPIEPASPIPDYKSTDWKQLLAGVRAVPGVRVVVLNHPSNVHSNFKPTDPSRFHAHSGEGLDKREWDFDGIEVVTSAALQSDLMKPVRDWFALLNSGRKMAGIGSSDTHEVNAYILGQGRTYIASRAQRPDGIDVQEICDNLKAGRALVSMGLLTEAWVHGKHGVGDLARNLSKEVSVRVKVQGPRWIRADRLELYANGRKVLERPIQHAESAVVKCDSNLRIPLPQNDAWLVAIATGPGIDKPYWPIPRPYQPTNPVWEPRVIGTTNPIWLDADNDGTYTSPAQYARKAVDSAGNNLARALDLLRGYDESVAVQAAALLRSRGVDLSAPENRGAIDRADPSIRLAFTAYLSALPSNR